MATVLIPPHLTFPRGPNPMQPSVWVGCQEADLPAQPSANQFFTWGRSSTGFPLSLGPAAMMGGPKGSSARA